MTLTIGTLVWAKFHNWPHWPSKVAKILDVPLETRDGLGERPEGHTLVFFFGSKNYAFIPTDQLFNWDEHFDEYSKPKKGSKQLMAGINDAQKYKNGESSSESESEEEITDKTPQGKNKKRQREEIESEDEQTPDPPRKRGRPPLNKGKEEKLKETPKFEKSKENPKFDSKNTETLKSDKKKDSPKSERRFSKVEVPSPTSTPTPKEKKKPGRKPKSVSTPKDEKDEKKVEGNRSPKSTPPKKSNKKEELKKDNKEDDKKEEKNVSSKDNENRSNGNTKMKEGVNPKKRKLASALEETQERERKEREDKERKEVEEIERKEKVEKENKYREDKERKEKEEKERKEIEEKKNSELGLNFNSLDDLEFVENGHVVVSPNQNKKLIRLNHSAIANAVHNISRHPVAKYYNYNVVSYSEGVATAKAQFSAARTSIYETHCSIAAIHYLLDITSYIALIMNLHDGETAITQDIHVSVFHQIPPGAQVILKARVITIKDNIAFIDAEAILNSRLAMSGRIIKNLTEFHNSLNGPKDKSLLEQ